MNSISSPMIGGQYFRSPSISQIPTVSQQQQPYYQSPFSPGMSMPTMNVAQPSNIVGTVGVSVSLILILFVPHWNVYLKINSMPSSSGSLETSDSRSIPSSVQMPYDIKVGSVGVDNMSPSVTMLVGAPSKDPTSIAYDRPTGMQVPSLSFTDTANINVDVEVPDMPSFDSYYSTAIEQPRIPTVSHYSSSVLFPPSLPYNNLPSMTPSQVPAHYSCYNNLQIIGNINVQNIFHLNSLQQTTISDIINSQSQSSGYSFSSFHYPYHTIVINLRVNIYVHTLTLGSQSNVQRYGLRLYNPLRNVDDTYYSSKLPEFNNQ
ncbi:unnamed protein product, partial [Rotaria sordida]